VRGGEVEGKGKAERKRREWKNEAVREGWKEVKDSTATERHPSGPTWYLTVCVPFCPLPVCSPSSCLSSCPFYASLPCTNTTWQERLEVERCSETQQQGHDLLRPLVERSAIDMLSSLDDDADDAVTDNKIVLNQMPSHRKAWGHRLVASSSSRTSSSSSSSPRPAISPNRLSSGPSRPITAPAVRDRPLVTLSIAPVDLLSPSLLPSCAGIASAAPPQPAGCYTSSRPTSRENRGWAREDLYMSFLRPTSTAKSTLAPRRQAHASHGASAAVVAHVARGHPLVRRRGEHGHGHEPEGIYSIAGSEAAHKDNRHMAMPARWTPRVNAALSQPHLGGQSHTGASSPRACFVSPPRKSNVHSKDTVCGALPVHLGYSPSVLTPRRRQQLDSRGCSLGCRHLCTRPCSEDKEV